MNRRPEIASTEDRPVRIRILHLITGLQTGGAEAMLEKLVTSMSRERFESIVVSLTTVGPVGQRLLSAGFCVENLNMKRGGIDAFGLFRLLNLLRRFQPTVLQSWLYHADLLGTAATWFSPVSAFAWNVRCTDMDFSRYTPLTRWVMRVLARLSSIPDVVIANSEAGRAWHMRCGYRPKRWEIIPNGFDLDRFQPNSQARASLRAELGVAADTLLIGLPARVDPMKDHATFLAAARQLLDDGHKVRFVLVGRGADLANPIIAEPLSRLKLGDAVCALGERADIDRILPGLDIAVLASAFGEGFPNVLGEAMACGVCCVSTNVGDAAAILDGIGEIVAPRDAAYLAAAMAKLAAMSPGDRDRLGMMGRERIRRSFAIAPIVARYEALYEQIAGYRSGGRSVIERGIPQEIA
jgi:glycosyltransferase involved in cell wall biosynthesis